MIERPNDQRGFLHKSFIGKAVGKAVKTFVPGVSTAVDVFGTARSFLGGRGGGGGGRSFGRAATRPVSSRTLTARPSFASAQGKEAGRALKFGGNGGPSPALSLPFVPDDRTSPCRSGETARCCRLRNGDFNEQRAWQRECGTAGNGASPTEVGEAVMGRYGAALEPGVMTIERSVCLPGMNLGNDGLCYNKGAITNSQRQWPRGRRPLLTGGDMRAIGIAARAGSKLDRTTKRLRSLGMMKALPKARGARHPALRIPVHKSVDV